jgi:excisionase family DNA binding protein
METIETRPPAVMAGYVKIDQAANYLSMSRAKVYMLMDSGQLAYVKVDKCRRISWDELRRFMSNHTIQATR